jgi:hypothetical protein
MPSIAWARGHKGIGSSRPCAACAPYEARPFWRSSDPQPPESVTTLCTAIPCAAISSAASARRWGLRVVQLPSPSADGPQAGGCAGRGGFPLFVTLLTNRRSADPRGPEDSDARAAGAGPRDPSRPGWWRAGPAGAGASSPVRRTASGPRARSREPRGAWRTPARPSAGRGSPLPADPWGAPGLL